MKVPLVDIIKLSTNNRLKGRGVKTVAYAVDYCEERRRK